MEFSVEKINESGLILPLNVKIKGVQKFWHSSLKIIYKMFILHLVCVVTIWFGCYFPMTVIFTCKNKLEDIVKIWVYDCLLSLKFII